MVVKTEQPPDKVEFNVIALIDITFLIIIFLLVTTEFSSLERVEGLALPQAVETKPETGHKQRLVISVDRQNRIFVGGRVITIEQVDVMLRRERVINHEDLSKKTEQPILIAADRDVPWQTVQDILEKAAKWKFQKVSFSAETEVKPK